MIKNIFLTAIVFVLAFNANAQNDTMYIMKSGAVVGKYNVNDQVDSVIFYKPTTTTVMDYDGNVYNTVTIGTQVWMKENLKTTHYSDGTEIPFVNSTSSWDVLTGTDKGYCWYNDDADNKAVYGALYTWAAAMNGAASSSNEPSGIQGVCPSGWHLPSDAEWAALTTYLDGVGVAGGKLKETGTTHWANPNTGATDETGFTALPGGNRNGSGTFNNVGEYGYWWSATEYNAIESWHRNMSYGSSNVYRSNDGKGFGFSVRCLKD